VSASNDLKNKTQIAASRAENVGSVVQGEKKILKTEKEGLSNAVG